MYYIKYGGVDTAVLHHTASYTANYTAVIFISYGGIRRDTAIYTALP